MKQKNSVACTANTADCRQIDLLDGMALLTLIALPFIMYYLWVRDVPPIHRITMTQEACKALASAGAPMIPAPNGEGCTATLPLDLHNPFEKFPVIYFMKDGIQQELMVSPNLIISTMPLTK